MNEHSLHSAIKDWYSLPGDEFEVTVDAFIIDIARGDLLIEIQTKNFSAIKKKLERLIRKHKTLLVYPIPRRKWIIRTTKSGKIIYRRKSPRKGKLTDLFYELVSFPHLITENNFSMEVLMIDEEEVRCDDGKGSWRRKGVSIKDRRLMDVTEIVPFHNEHDFHRFLINDHNEPFSNRNLAERKGIPINLARKITYCLRKMNVITSIGKNGRELLFKTC